MKKIISCLLAVCSFATCLSGLTAAQAASDSVKTQESKYIATAKFGKKNVMSNISAVKTAGSTSLTYSQGTEVIEMGLVDSDYRRLEGNGRIFIDISDSFFCGNTDGSEFIVTVDYIDSDNTSFNIKYDAIGDYQGNTRMQYAGLTNLVKQATWVLKDADFANGQKGYDIEIGWPDTRSHRWKRTTKISGITIERIPGKNKVMGKIKSDVVGHIFNYKELPHFENTVTNYTDEEQKVKVKYTAENKLGGKEWVSEEEVVLAPREVKTLEVNPELKTYGLYYFETEIYNDTFSWTDETECSLVNTPPEGMFNARMGYATQLSAEIPEEVQEKQAQVVLKSGSRSIRNPMRWMWDDENLKYTRSTINTAKKYDLDAVWQVFLGHRDYTGGDYSIPYTQQHLNAAMKYIDAIMKAWDNDEAKFELWNEPNIPNFSTNGGPSVEGAKNYAWFATNMAKMMKEKYPGMQIGALSLTGISMTEETHRPKGYVQALIDEGGFEYIDAGTYHPYYSAGEPEQAYEKKNTLTLIDMIRDAGYTDKKAWLTEIGWTSALSGGIQFTERQRGAWLPRYFIIWDEEPNMEYFFVHTLCKEDVFLDERESQFGIVGMAWSYDGTKSNDENVSCKAYEAYAQFTNMNNIVAGCDHNTRIETNVDEVYAYKYTDKNRDRDVLAFWKRYEDQKDAIHVKLGAKQVTLVDPYGNEMQLESENGEYDLLPDFDVNYIMGKFGEISIGPSDMKISDVNINAIAEDALSLSVSGVGNADNADVAGTGFVTIDDKTVVANGNANVTINVPSLKEDKSSFYLLIKEGDKTRSALRVYLDKSDVMSTNMTVSVHGNDYTKWNTTVDITNNSQLRVIKGDLKIKKIAGDTAGVKAVYTGPIPPGKTARLNIQLPRVYVRNLKDIEYEIKLDNGETYSFSDTANFAFSPYMKTPPKIDGVWDKGEWEDNTYFVVNDKSEIKNITDWAGPSDLSATIYTAWDYDNFYITTKVRDDIFVNTKKDSQIWDGDSIQFGLVYGKETFVAIGNFGEKYTELGAAKTSDGDQMWCWMREDTDREGAGPVPEYDLAIQRDEETQTTTYEISIPWSVILPQNIKEFDPNRAIGFSLLVNDDDGSGRRGWIEYASGIGASKNTSLFTYLRFLNNDK